MQRFHILLTLIAWLTLTVAAQKKPTLQAASKAWDTNRDGVLQPSEIPAQWKSKINTLAKRQGLSLEKGLPLDRLFAKGGLRAKKSSKSSKRAEARAVRKNTAADAVPQTGSMQVKSQEKRESLGRGFASASPADRVRGFGPGQATPESRSEDRQTTKQEAPEPAKKSGDTKKDRTKKHYRMLASSLLAQHDTNKNGKLEKREWSKLRGTPADSDQNGDKILTVEELQNHLAGYGNRDKPPRKPKKAVRARRKTPSVKTYRFRTAHERLPQDLPAWFLERDANRDGQLSYREFTTRLSQAKLDEFLGLDLNRDGLIVPKEYLKATDE